MGLYNFIVAFPRLEDFLHLPIPKLIKFRQARARLDTIVNRLITDHRNAGVDKGDLLSMLLASRDEQPDTSGHHTGMSDEQIRDEVLTIFLAGYETGANGLTWTSYLLRQTPEAEAKLHAELDTVLGIGIQKRLPTLADFSNLRYTEQVFAESMRLYPPAWPMGRMSTQPVQLRHYRITASSH